MIAIKRIISLLAVAYGLALALAVSPSQAQQAKTIGIQGWKQSTGFNNSFGNVRGFLRYGKFLLARANGDSLFASTDDGLTWRGFAPNENRALPLLAVGSLSAPVLIAEADSNPHIFSFLKLLYYSTNSGQSWTPDTLGWPIPGGEPMSIISVGSTIFIGTAVGVSHQTAPGARWTPDTVGISDFPVTDLIASGNTIFASLGYFGGVFASTNYGASWIHANNGLPFGDYGGGWGKSFLRVSGFALSGSSLFAIVQHDSTNATYDIYRTANNGQDWTRMNSAPLNVGIFLPSFTAAGKNLFVESLDRGIFVSTDSGKTWFQANQGLPGVVPDTLAKSAVHGDTTSVKFSFSTSDNAPRFSGIHVSGGNVIIGCGNGVWVRKLSDFGIN